MNNLNFKKSILPTLVGGIFLSSGVNATVEDTQSQVDTITFGTSISTYYPDKEPIQIDYVELNNIFASALREYGTVAFIGADNIIEAFNYMFDDFGLILEAESNDTENPFISIWGKGKDENGEDVYYNLDINGIFVGKFLEELISHKQRITGNISLGYFMTGENENIESDNINQYLNAKGKFVTTVDKYIRLLTSAQQDGNITENELHTAKYKEVLSLLRPILNGTNFTIKAGGNYDEGSTKSNGSGNFDISYKKGDGNSFSNVFVAKNDNVVGTGVGIENLGFSIGGNIGDKYNFGVLGGSVKYTSIKVSWGKSDEYTYSNDTKGNAIGGAFSYNLARKVGSIDIGLIAGMNLQFLESTNNIGKEVKSLYGSGLSYATIGYTGGQFELDGRFGKSFFGAPKDIELWKSIDEISEDDRKRGLLGGNYRGFDLIWKPTNGINISGFYGSSDNVLTKEEQSGISISYNGLKLGTEIKQTTNKDKLSPMKNNKVSILKTEYKGKLMSWAIINIVQSTSSDNSTILSLEMTY